MAMDPCGTVMQCLRGTYMTVPPVLSVDYRFVFGNGGNRSARSLVMLVTSIRLEPGAGLVFVDVPARGQFQVPAGGGQLGVYQGASMGPMYVPARGSPDRLSHPWKGERSPAAQASRSPGVLRSQSGRISLVAARRSRHRS